MEHSSLARADTQRLVKNTVGEKKGHSGDIALSVVKRIVKEHVFSSPHALDNPENIGKNQESGFYPQPLQSLKGFSWCWVQFLLQCS